MQDHYAALGLGRNASQDEIKEAFRRLAKQHHPDVGGNPDKFKSINEAYDILKDPDKRAAYDNPPHNFRSANMNWASYADYPLDLDEIFRSFAGAGFPHGKRSQRNSNIRMSLSVPLSSLVADQTKIVKIGGNVNKEIEVKIPKGVRSGAVISYKGLGNQEIKTISPGDLLIEINVMQDSRFQRQGDDLHSNLTVDAIDAMLGTHTIFKTIDDKDLRINIPKGMQNGAILRLQGEGLPSGKGDKCGDQYLHVSIHIPTNLNKFQLELLAQFKDLSGP